MKKHVFFLLVIGIFVLLSSFVSASDFDFDTSLTTVYNFGQNYNISDLIQSIKGNFSRKLHMGKIWQPRFYTRVVSTRKYLYTVIEYIKYNPVKAELPIKYSKEPYQYFSMVNKKTPLRY